MLDIAAACLVITALLAYVNHRFVGMPTTIDVMATALVLSLALVGLTYCVAVFSILAQGLSIGRVTRLALARRQSE